MQHARPVGPTTANAAAAFGQEMVAGSCLPERSRAFYASANRQGLALSQPTHVAATLAPSMSQGWQPPEQRYSAPLHAGWLAQSADVQSFSVEMAQGSRPDQPRIMLGPQIGQPIGQTTPVVVANPFGIEMVSGSHPDTGRIMLGPRIALPVSQPTHTAATFTIDMVAGHQPPAKRYVAPFHQGAQLWTTEVNVFSMEMAQGAVSGRPRLLLGAKVPLPVSQVTHTAATFSVEMTQGATLPARSRTFTTLKGGWTINQAAFATTTTVFPWLYYQQMRAR